LTPIGLGSGNASIASASRHWLTKH